jgi:hypothetical protein
MELLDAQSRVIARAHEIIPPPNIDGEKLPIIAGYRFIESILGKEGSFGLIPVDEVPIEAEKERLLKQMVAVNSDLAVAARYTKPKGGTGNGHWSLVVFSPDKDKNVKPCKVI